MFCFGLTLTSLELRVLLVDHIEATLTTYDLAVGSALLQGCSCLHIWGVYYLYRNTILPFDRS